MIQLARLNVKDPAACGVVARDENGLRQNKDVLPRNTFASKYIDATFGLVTFEPPYGRKGSLLLVKD